MFRGCGSVRLAAGIHKGAAHLVLDERTPVQAYESSVVQMDQ